MRIEILYTMECPWCVKTREIVRESLKGLGVKAVVKEILIDSDAKARKHGFPGSPTVRVDGKDVQENPAKGKCLPCEDLAMKGRASEFARKDCRCGCRIYLYRGKQYPYPPKGMIKESIIKRI